MTAKRRGKRELERAARELERGSIFSLRRGSATALLVARPRSRKSSLSLLRLSSHLHGRRHVVAVELADLVAVRRQDGLAPGGVRLDGRGPEELVRLFRGGVVVNVVVLLRRRRCRGRRCCSKAHLSRSGFTRGVGRRGQKARNCCTKRSREKERTGRESGATVLLEAFSFAKFRRKNVISSPQLFFLRFSSSRPQPPLSLSFSTPRALFSSETKERQKKVITLLSFVDQQQL